MYLRLIIIGILAFCNANEDTMGYAGMVSSTSDLASLAGKRILAKGGTAADAAVAVQMVLNVVGPFASGIGGGAFIMYYDAENKVIRALDGREEAPAEFNPYVFCDETSCFDTNGTSGDCDDCTPIDSDERRTGGLSVGVPGTLYAMKRLYELYGIGEDIISWPELFEDAIHYAANGFSAYPTFIDDIEDYIPYLGRFESSCKLLLNYPICNESKYEVGDNITNIDLAQTFMHLAELGADGAVEEFYNGDMAKAIVNTSRSAINPVTQRGGEITQEDMNKYRAVFREPISSTITFNDEDYTFYGMNMPSSGPLTVQYALKLIEFLQEEYDVDEFDNDPYSADVLHYTFSAGNIAFADRNQYMADQDFVNVPVDGMLKPEYIEERAADYLTNMAQDLPIPYGRPDGFNDTYPESSVNEQGTAHFCIVDRFGNVASITTTIEGKWGSMVVVDGYGFFLNNELTDFSVPGIVDGEKVANAPEGGKKPRRSAIDPFGDGDDESLGGKRPRSSMSPTIVLSSDGTSYLAVGGRGGPTIIGTVISVLIRSLIYGMSAQEAINAPRVYGMNGLFSTDLVTFEKTLWEQYNMNITSKMVSKFGYNENYLFNVVFGSGNMIIAGDDNLLYCGVDISRLETEGCSAVCNVSDSSCPFAMTTVYPQSTNIETTMYDTCNDDDYNWIIRITFRVVLNVNVAESDNREKIRTSCKRAFFKSVAENLMDWMEDFCFDLSDDQLTINEYTETSTRRLLETEYEIEAGFEYNDDLQDAVFDSDSSVNEFGTIFNDELIDILVEEEIIDANTTDIYVAISTPEEEEEDDSDHKVEGGLINFTLVTSLICCMIFCGCMIYFVRFIYPRVKVEGDIDLKEARERYKLPYAIAFVEILDSLVHWIFAIMLIAKHSSYLGWILFCLLLGGEVILYLRFIFYKQLILYQIPKLRQEMEQEKGLQDAIIDRKTDVAMMGITLGMVEDLPVIIIAFIAGQNFGYKAEMTLAIVIAIVSLVMKLGLLFAARFGSTEPEKVEKPKKGIDSQVASSPKKQSKDEKATAKAIELAEDKQEKTQLNGGNDVKEEEEEDEKEKEQQEKTKEDEQEEYNAEPAKQEEQPLNTDDKDKEEQMDTNKDTKKDDKYID